MTWNSGHLEMTIEVTSPAKENRDTEFLAESKENIEWVVKESHKDQS